MAQQPLQESERARLESLRREWDETPSGGSYSRWLEEQVLGLTVERDCYREALERIGEMAGAKANGKDARAMGKLARTMLNG